VTDVMEGALTPGKASAQQYARVAEEVMEYARLSPAQLEKQVANLEQQMYEHARNLEFEEAAALRDRIRHIQEGNMGLLE
jgi:excinuclease ABC subunit B